MNTHTTTRRLAARLLLASLLLVPGVLQAQTDTLRLAGLEQPVEIIKDHWGISHIYAQTEADLFFAQGYNAARDRLFQFEIWRRQATGTVAEILGPRALDRDIGARLHRFRGDMKQEMLHYHPHGDIIIPAFVRGVNAYIAETERDTSLLPLEFRLLGIRPGRWTPEVVVSRHQGLVGNVRQELDIARDVVVVGEDLVRELRRFHPGRPDLTLATGIDSAALAPDILHLYNAYRRSVRFEPEDIVAAYRGADSMYVRLAASLPSEPELAGLGTSIGSNNWVVSGRLTSSGMPFMANDPHRVQQAPSLRYYVHLVAPGWNVIGGGEPVLPGVSIGHNEHGAWGLTVFGIDSEDLYVYETNPANPRQYRYRGGWEDMRVIRDTIPVKGRSPAIVDLKYTRHGPVLYEDSAHHRAYALRAAWLEVGGAPYLASLRMDQARTFEEFREACGYSNIPSENMVWADTSGMIGWQAVGIAPLRPNWSGLVPVPGDGSYEWRGYLPIRELPHSTDPPEGFRATANQYVVGPDYAQRNAIPWTWAEPFRGDRIEEVLGSGRRFRLADMMRLQQDELSIPARTIVPLLEPLHSADGELERARTMLLDWDYVLDAGSIEAAIYATWERRLEPAVAAVLIPESARDQVGTNISTGLMLDALLAPDGRFGPHPVLARDSLLLRTLALALADLHERLGDDMSTWHYGQEKFKHVLLHHPMSAAVDAATRRKLDVGPAPRGGYGNTVNATGNGDNQTAGASFRIIADLSDWDHSVGTNTPGQSGNPDDPHYRDLFGLWATGRYFPILYSRERVEGVAERRTWLLPH